MSKVFNEKATNHLKAKMFLDPKGGPEIARYEEVKYPTFENFTEKQLSFFWRPEEVDLSKDKLDFRDLTLHEQHIFTSNLFRQILLDSVQGRGPNLMLLPIASLPEVEALYVFPSCTKELVTKNVFPFLSRLINWRLDLKARKASAGSDLGS